MQRTTCRAWVPNNCLVARRANERQDDTLQSAKTSHGRSEAAAGILSGTELWRLRLRRALSQKNESQLAPCPSSYIWGRGPRNNCLSLFFLPFFFLVKYQLLLCPSRIGEQFWWTFSRNKLFPVKVNNKGGRSSPEVFFGGWNYYSSA